MRLPRKKNAVSSNLTIGSKLLYTDYMDAKRDTKRIGNISEIAVMAALVKKHRAVLVPWGENDRYDLVVEDQGTFKRIQCKTGRLKQGNSVIIFNTESQSKAGRQSYRGQVEYIGVYCPTLDTSYLVPIELLGTRGSMRLLPTKKNWKNNPKQRMLWAKDFEV